MKKTVIALVFMLLVMNIFTGCEGFSPSPVITEGEFNFSVTYEYNGEEKTISGVYKCKYNGQSWALDGGFNRSWSGVSDNGIEDGIKLGTTENGGDINLVMNLYPDYFMGEDAGFRDTPAPYFQIITVEEDGATGIINEADVIEALCGAKIISYSYDEPIKNSFN